MAPCNYWIGVVSRAHTQLGLAHLSFVADKTQWSAALAEAAA